MNVLAIGAHADDIDLGCGGALARHVALGHQVYALILQSGTRTADPEVRIQEQVASLGLLGVEAENIVFGRYSSQDLMIQANILDVVRGYVDRWEINLVYSHHDEDTHNDHINVSRGVAPAVKSLQNILYYETPSTVNFSPTVCYDMPAETLDKKIAAIAEHKTQIARRSCDLDLRDWVRQTAAFRGMQFRTDYAEGFVAVRLSFLA